MNTIVIDKTFVTATQEPGLYRDCKLLGFCLKVTDAGKKIYLVKKKVKGGSTDITVTLGRHGEDGWTATKAREAADDIIMKMKQGINPNQERQDEAKQSKAKKVAEDALQKAMSVTLRTVWDDYRERNLKDETKYIYGKLIHRYLGDWLDRPIVEISKDMVERRYEYLRNDAPVRTTKRAKDKGHKTAQANHIMRILRALFNFASAKYEDPSGKPILVENPVRRLSQARLWERDHRRQSVILPHQLPDWYEAVRTKGGETIGDYLIVVLLTGLRKDEAARLVWRNVDFKAQTIKVEDTKNHEDHVLPMTDYLYTLLRGRWQKRRNEFVFPGQGAESHLSDPRYVLAAIIDQSKVPFTIHDLRRTFVTTAEKLDTPYYALKKLVNHKTTADVTAGYIVTDVERLREPMKKINKQMLIWMGLEQAEAPSGAAPAIAHNVVPMTKAK